jgi:uncharacterized protein YggU (UPF0235/DUF167 family)
MYIRVTVTPSAKKELFKERREGEFEISVREKAERNLANIRVLELVAEHFNVSRGSVKIVAGHRSSKKILSVEV